MFKIYVKGFSKADYLANKKRGHRIFINRKAHNFSIIQKRKKAIFYHGTKKI